MLDGISYSFWMFFWLKGVNTDSAIAPRPSHIILDLIETGPSTHAPM